MQILPSSPPRLSRTRCRLARWTLAWLLLVALTSCGGGSTRAGANSSGSGEHAVGSAGNTKVGSAGNIKVGTEGKVRLAALTVNVTGFNGTIDLADDINHNSLELSAPSPITTFENLLPGTHYSVSVTKEPVAQVCKVQVPKGTIGSAPILDPITCGPGTGRMLYEFFGAPIDGSEPLGGLTSVGGDSFLGTAIGGGTYGSGSIYIVDVADSIPDMTVYHNFRGAPGDGAGPEYPPDPLPEQPGTFIGATTGGGTSNVGAIYTFLENSGGTILDASFSANSSGSYPSSPLLDVNGTYFGTTFAGGADHGGTFYAFTPGPSLRYGTLTTLGNFGSSRVPLLHPHGRMVHAYNGQTLGVAAGTTTGATNTGGGVFEYDRTHVDAICEFNNPAGPYEPSGGLAQTWNGRLYGVTATGGANGAGTIYRVNPFYDYCREVYSFTDGNNEGGSPRGTPFLSRAGNLYVTTTTGGRYDQGALVELSTNGTLLGTLYQFGANGGPRSPSGKLLEDPLTGYLYGTTAGGGASGGDNGTIYRID